MSKDEHPYKQQPAKAFWRNVADNRAPVDIADWYTKKWDITGARVASAGSCFAQHIGRQLKAQGFNYLDVEPAPSCLAPERVTEWGFGMYSARYGNVYTTRQLLQLAQRATGHFSPAEIAWEKDGGFVDPFRPTIEPVPLASVEEVIACRDSHLKAVASLLEQTDVFVFTLGLTEGWVSTEDGAVFPVCPGTHGGRFDAARYKFVNFSYPGVRSDLEEFMQLARQINGKMRFLLTVSPVPLAATATQQQVIVATMYSKSVLRSVAGFLAEKYNYVDYFPSFEIISSHVMRGQFYAADMRSVEAAGVEHVMAQFFSEHAPPGADAEAGDRRRKEATTAPVSAATRSERAQDVVCDEELLAAFGERK